MTLQEKLRYLQERHPEIYETLCITVPGLIENPSSPTSDDLDEYNFWIDALDEDEAQPLYHLDGLSW